MIEGFGGTNKGNTSSYKSERFLEIMNNVLEGFGSLVDMNMDGVGNMNIRNRLVQKFQ